MPVSVSPLNPPNRLLMGPGPSDVSPRVLRALGSQTIGHLDPEYLRIMDETREMMRQVFKTKNDLTLAVSGTGMAGMECIIANMIECGDEMLVGVNGVFGSRMVDVAQRYGAKVTTIERPYGEIFDPSEIEAALKANPAIKLVGIVQAETSTGAHQPLEEISRIVHAAGALLVVDAVTSLAGVDLRIDEWQVDACYSGTQKNLSCPPGLSPVTFSPAAVARLDQRKTKVISWYLDLTMVRQYWGGGRVYHHTAPINMTYALREALAEIVEEGLEARYARHALHHKALRAGLEAMGLSYIPKHSLPNLNAIHIPNGIDDAKVRGRMLNDFGIEIGGGLGPFKGKAWRIGIMGSSCTRRHVTSCLAALETILASEGHSLSRGAALKSADDVYTKA